MKLSKLFVSAFVLFSGLAVARKDSTSDSDSNTAPKVNEDQEINVETSLLNAEGRKLLDHMEAQVRQVLESRTAQNLSDYASKDEMIKDVMYHAKVATGSISEQTFGVALMVIGLFVCFSGCRYFKPFVSIVSALIGATVAHLLYGYFNLVSYVGAEKSFYVEGALCALAAVIFSLVLLTALKFAVFVFGTAGGFVGGVLLFGLGREDVFAPYGIEESTVILLCACIGAIFANFFEFVAIVTASALIGSMTIGYGFDFIYHIGLRNLISKFSIDSSSDAAVAVSLVAKELEKDGELAAASMVMVFVAVCGIYCQIRFGPRNFGRK